MDSHKTHPPRPSRLPQLRAELPRASQGGWAGAQEGTSAGLALDISDTTPLRPAHSSSTPTAAQGPGTNHSGIWGSLQLAAVPRRGRVGAEPRKGSSGLKDQFLSCQQGKGHLSSTLHTRLGRPQLSISPCASHRLCPSPGPRPLLEAPLCPLNGRATQGSAHARAPLAVTLSRAMSL